MMALLKLIIFLGYLNWFFAIGYCLFQMIKGRRDKLFMIRSVLTLIIPWVGGIVFWLFPYVIGLFKKKEKVEE